MLYQVPSYPSTSNHIHCGESFWQYLEGARIHHEYIEVAKHFEYQEWCRNILSNRVCCP